MLKHRLKQWMPTAIREPALDRYHAIREFMRYHAVRGRKEPFVLNGEAYRYFSHHHNHTYDNERTVEIPIALRALERFQGQRILEIGNVMAYYTMISHAVVDKYEKRAGVINIDIRDYAPAERFDLILSISTFEHIDFDEARYGEDKRDVPAGGGILEAMAHTKTLLAPGGLFLMTVPLGANPHLDQSIGNGSLLMSDLWFLKRVSRSNRWQQVGLESVRGAQYGAPFSPGANVVLVAEFMNL